MARHSDGPQSNRSPASIPFRLNAEQPRESNSFSHVLRILLILFADELKEFGIRLKIEFSTNCPRPGVSFRIVDGHLHVHVSEIPPPKTFHKVKILRGRMTRLVEPCLSVHPDSIDHESISVPLADRVT